MAAINNIKEEIRALFENDSSGHDYWHSLRVYHAAMKIAATEPCNKEIVAIAALLHDVDDVKLFSSDNYENARSIMRRNGIDEDTANCIIDIIKDIPYRGTESVVPASMEGKIVQDADRLDAMGAIGIARTFAYGGSAGIPVFDPDIKPQEIMDAKAYQTRQSSSINHFYEKLFFLKQMMNTETARAIAAPRDSYLRSFLTEFLCEWNFFEECENE